MQIERSSFRIVQSSEAGTEMRKAITSMLLLSCSIIAAAADPAKPPAPGATFLQFPKSSVGRIYIVNDNVDFGQRRIDLHNLTAAAGKVERAKGQAFSLKLNYAGGTDLSFLNNLKPNDLIGLDSNDIAIECSGLKYLQNLKGLKRLELRNSDFSDKELPYLKNLPLLECLDISKTMIDGSGLAVMKTLTHLETLRLANNALIPGATANLAGLSRLKELYLSSTSVGDADMVNIAKIKSLTTIKLADNKKITDAGVAALAALPNLNMLELSGSSATIASLPSLKKMHQLKHLFISSPKLTAKQLAQMQQALPGCKVDQAVQPKLPLEIFEPLH
jgi:hypothetical protein